MNPRRDSENDIRWVDVYNDSGEEIPAYAVVKVTGTDEDGVLIVTKPDEDSLPPAKLLFTGPAAIPTDGYGAATRDWPARCQFSVPDGSTYGTEADNWHLIEGGSGFIPWGTADEDDESQLFTADSGGAGTTVALVKVSAGPTTVNSIDYYLGNITTFDPGDPSSTTEGAWSDAGASVLLVQRFNIDLTVGGCYIAVSTGKPKWVTIDMVERRLTVWMTSEFPAIGADCVLLN